MVPVVTMCGVLAVATPMAPLYATLGVTAAAFLLVGLIDDRGQIRPLYRLLLSTILCLGARARGAGAGRRFSPVQLLPPPDRGPALG